ncbi:hypothetical protein ACFXGT_08215 [Streptomyces sp. NPDC059352]|uniref:hypothetical protein n=1 Tax=Streptomyces sp. NPDC059352 TaxID=3346810 RepID=UPI0036A21C50
MTQPTDRPAEHCGHQPDPAIGQPTECVLRPGHSGSHADHRGMRWWMANLGHTPISQDPAPERPGINHLTSDQLDQLYAERDMLGRDADRLFRDAAEALARAEQAEAELALLHEGEKPHTDDRVVPTPAQWIWQWNRATPAKRMEVATALIDASERADRCFIENHKNALPALRQRTLAAETTLTAVRDELTAIEQTHDALDCECEAEASAGTVARIRAVLDQHSQTPTEPT